MCCLADAVRAWEVLDQEADQEGGWEAHDIEVIALEPLDKRGAQALDGVAARSALPLAAANVVG
jgi:hypothetical protein